MRTILINPWDCTVTETDTPLEAPDGWRSIYEAIGPGVSTFDVVPFSPGHVLYVDDEGLYPEKANPAFSVPGWPHLIYGKALVVGDDGEGDNVPCTLTPHTVFNHIRFPVFGIRVAPGCVI